MRATERTKKPVKAVAKRPNKTKEPAKKVVPQKAGKSLAKSKALAAVDALLRQPEPKRAGASAAGAARPAVPQKLAGSDLTGSNSRFERSISRAQKGEAGPILLKDLILDPQAEATARESGRVALYRKILSDNPQAQPGRPLVNIVGNSDRDLKFQLLSLHELVIAALEMGRDQVQVLLVRLTEVEAVKLLAQPEVAVPLSEELSPLEIARMNGFLELPIAEIIRSENLRQEILIDGPDFRNLVSSIETIGLQNPPVVEVRVAEDEKETHFVCVSGHRRLLALETLGEVRITCALKTFKSERHRALAGLAENINREDLHFLDKADGYGLLERQGMSVHEIAALLDADQRTVSKYLRASAWDVGVKRRLRELGPKVTTRFLLNMLAAGERTTTELHALIDRFVAAAEKTGKMKRGAQVRQKLEEFYTLSDVSLDTRLVVEKALRFLGYLR
jgi:ParB/RepB/Spo0J family partition protein